MVNCRKEIFTGGVYEKEEIHWAFGGDLSSASWIIQQYKRFCGSNRRESRGDSYQMCIRDRCGTGSCDGDCAGEIL